MLKLQEISKKLPGFALKKVSFEVNEGDYFILLGESGAGKSLVLETIAGLVRPDSGSLLLDGRDITHVRIHDRGIGLVFQDYAVFPHLSVKSNLFYPLHGSSMSHSAKADLIRTIASEAGIAHLLNRRPSTLSGGELQRVALARTLVQKPRVLLLDEPLSSLDSQLRSGLRSLLRQLNREGQAIVHVTHDYEEAISLATRIAVIHKGEILQAGTPEEVFHYPRSEFVAHFIGAKNFFRSVSAVENGIPLAILNPDLKIRIARESEEKEGFVLIRSEDIVVSNERLDSSAVNIFKGTVAEIISARNGAEVLIDIGVQVYSIITHTSLHHLELTPGKKVWISFKASAARFIPA
jgi:molybdopterin-binding protein